MKKNYLRHICYALCYVFLLIGCNKEIDEPSSLNAVVQSDSRSEKHDDDCRQVMQSGTFGEISYKYNKQGLVSEWTAYYLEGSYFKHDYNRAGRLKKATSYLSDGSLSFTIVFSYNKYGRVYREIWYDGNTTTVIDDVYYTFNSKGFVTKMISEFLDYHVDYEHDRVGNLTKFTYYEGDEPYSGGVYTYFSRVKNAQAVIPGLDYNYYVINGVYAFNKWYSTSEKFIFWENGVPVVTSDQDPAKTRMTVNKQRYPINVEYFDKVSGETIVFDFKYSNCESCKDRNYSSAFSSAGSSRTAKSRVFNRHLLRDPRKFRK